MSKESLLRALAKECRISIDEYSSEESFILTFPHEVASIEARIIFDDWFTRGDLVIFRFDIWPRTETGKGYGSKSLPILIKHALDHGYQNIIAHYVQPKSEWFWRQQGFEPLHNELNDFRFICPEK